MTVNITIIGLGQIGASIGLALASHKDQVTLTGHDKSPAIAREAHKLGAVDKINFNLPASVEGANVVILALPDPTTAQLNRLFTFEFMREIRRILLEADVGFEVSRTFVERVEAKAVGLPALKTVAPGQQLVKMVYEELVVLLGGDGPPAAIRFASVPPTVVFLVGLLGQILILPTFGMLIVGLILSVAGILLLPFAVVVYVLLAILGVVGGYLSVAHAIGETYTRRRMAQGAALGSPNSYRYLIVGLTGLFVLWAAWAVFGWVPVAGEIVRAAAVLVTWLMATAGLGAALLSRAGVRESFAGRLIPPEALTDEYLWATPQFGVPAVRRPESGPGTRPGTRHDAGR